MIMLDEAGINRFRARLVKRHHTDRIDRRGLGRSVCEWLFKWGYTTARDGTILPYILRLEKDGEWHRTSLVVDLRGLKRHNRQAWSLFRFCHMLAQCNTREFSPIILMDNRTWRDILRKHVFKPKRGASVNPLPDIISQMVLPEQFIEKTASQWTDIIERERQKRPVPFMELIQPEVRDEHTFNLCQRCQMSKAVRRRPASSPPERTWWKYNLFACPQHLWALSREPAMKCPYRAEMLITTQPGAKEMLSKS